MSFDFEGYRDADGVIELVACFKEAYPWLENTHIAESVLNRIMELQPIRSRQAAAIALVMALCTVSEG